MGLTVGQLKELLEQFDDNDQVRIASQPSWPFQYSVAGVVHRSAIIDEEDEVPRSNQKYEVNYPKVVYIIEGSQIGYASRRIWNHA